MAPTQKFKHLSYELIDIGLYTSRQSLDLIQQTTPYKVTDQYIHYEKKYNQMKEGGEKLFRFLNDKVYNPLKNQLYIIYDQSTNYISFFVHIL